MKKIILLITAPFAFIAALSAQTTQEQADSIVLERLHSETRAYTLYAKEGVQPEVTLTTSAGEVFELDYPCWVYCVKYTNETHIKYLIVKESNGNLLEINVRNDEDPADFEEWRIVMATGNLQHVQTELGGCNIQHEVKRSDSEIGNDTVMVTISENGISVFVSLHYTCKTAPFFTQVETIDNVIQMYLIDSCRHDTIECYRRCDCYYTFDFLFIKRENEIPLHERYQIWLIPSRRIGRIPVLISEGIIIR